MPIAALQKLVPAQARRFLPRRLDLGDWKEVKPWFDKLEKVLTRVKSARELARWVETAGELAAALDEEGAKRYINLTCQTDDPANERAYLDFIEKIDPQAKPRWHRLKELFLSNPYQHKLPAKRWEVFNRSVKNEIELFRPENVALQVEEARLEQQYQKLTGAMMVKFQGKAQTLQQMARYLEEPDRELRAEAWKLITSRRLQDRAKLDRLYDKLLHLRGQLAANAQLASYREFAFKLRGRFDYTPADCERFHAGVEDLVVPLARKLQAQRRQKLGVSPLRPWDLAVDVENRPPLKPFADSSELAAKCARIFRRLNPALARQYQILIDRNLLDLDSRKGKAPGGYQCSLEEARLPFIFMNAAGLHRDVVTMLHEAGHAFHSLAARDEALLSYRQAPLEFCEVASMGMELLTAPHLEEFYTPEDAERARRRHLEEIILLLPWIATIDAFQHWIYTHPGHSHAQRTTAWLALQKRFGGTEDYRGFKAARESGWQRQSHLFTSPFYYIEYGIAQLGALQLWLNAQKDVAAALKAYRRALALGGSRPLPELFAAAGLKFDFGPRTLQPVIRAVERALRR